MCMLYKISALHWFFYRGSNFVQTKNMFFNKNYGLKYKKGNFVKLKETEIKGFSKRFFGGGVMN